MIHIATVHWQDDRWIDIQLKYLKSNITRPFKIYAFLNDLERDHRSKFFYSSSEPIQSHAIKLNLLADMAAFNAEHGDDLLIFIDGDAFPVGDVLQFAYSKLNEYPLIAILRRENDGDIQPHPSFCVTTIKFWKEIDGDWKQGFGWKNTRGEKVTDVGGNLLKILDEKKIDWYPMLRSNRRDLHPLWFGLYEDLIYHHGAGFRPPLCRADLAELKAKESGRLPRWVCKVIPKRLRSQPLAKIKMENRTASEKVFASILSDPLFYEFFRESD
ncbi:MAG: hypothetical protein ABSH41_00150 [Syntrophobacteraceae bacterium]|jgi:hypothetical protein